MTDRCYQIISIVGSSAKSIEAAIQNAISAVEEKHGSVRWFEIDESRGHVHEGKIDHFQVSLRIGYHVS